MTLREDYKIEHDALGSNPTEQEQIDVWQKHLARKFLADGDTEIFTELQLQAAKKVQRLQVKRYVDGTLNDARYRLACREATDEVNDKLKSYGITTGFTRAWVDSMNDNYFTEERRLIGRDSVTLPQLLAVCPDIREVAKDMLVDFNDKFVQQIDKNTVLDRLKR